MAPSTGTMGASGFSSTAPGNSVPESLEIAGRRVEEMLHRDSEVPPLVTKLKIGKKIGIRLWFSFVRLLKMVL